MPMAPKGRKARLKIYDYIYIYGRQNKIYSCEIRLTTANFEHWHVDRLIVEDAIFLKQNFSFHVSSVAFLSYGVVGVSWCFGTTTPKI